MLDARVVAAVGDLRLDVALEVAPAETVAVLGPNGAGKTSLLRALAGFVPLAEGRMALDGEVLEDTAAGVRVPPERRKVGLVPQGDLLFPHLSLLDNVAFAPRSRGAKAAAASARARHELGLVGMVGRVGDRPGALSGGERQRVALARALAADPGLLLLDEPLASVDVAQRAEVRRLLRRRLAAVPVPVVFVTHDPLEAMALASQLTILEEGRVVQTGTAAAIVRHPRSPYVARLVGLNLLAGDGSRGRIDLDDGGVLSVPTDAATGPVFAVVHPQSVALHRRRPEGSPRNVWEGVVDDVEPGPDRVRVSVAAPVPLVAEVTRDGFAALEGRIGLAVWVSVKATEIEVYAR